MTQDISAPIWRERIQLSHTIKEGWRVSEATIEVTYSDDRIASLSQHDGLREERTRRLMRAITDGVDVADAKNLQAKGEK